MKECTHRSTLKIKGMIVQLLETLTGPATASNTASTDKCYAQSFESRQLVWTKNLDPVAIRVGDEGYALHFPWSVETQKAEACSEPTELVSSYRVFIVVLVPCLI